MKKCLQLGDSKWAFLAFSEKQSVKEKQDILLPQSFAFASVLDFDKCWANFSDLPIVHEWSVLMVITGGWQMQ